MIRRHCLLIAALALTGCETAHNAAVTTFRVVDAPAVYVRKQLNLDENDTDRGPATTTTSTTSTVTTTENPPPNNTVVTSQPFNQPVPANQPSVQRETVVTQPPPQRQVVVNERTTIPSPTPRPKPKPTPRLTSTTTETRKKESSPTPTPRVATAAEKASLPYAKPVPGKPGYVFSPFDPNGGYVDVTGFAPGSKVKDPYSGKIFLVP